MHSVSIMEVLKQNYTSCMKVGTGRNLDLSREYHKKLFGPLFHSWWNCPLREIMADCDHTDVFDLELCLGVSFDKRIQDILIEKAQQTWTNNCVTTNHQSTPNLLCYLCSPTQS